MWVLLYFIVPYFWVRLFFLYLSLPPPPVVLLIVFPVIPQLVNVTAFPIYPCEVSDVHGFEIYNF